MTATAIEELQEEVCKKYGADFLSSPNDFKVGIATNVRDEIVPINGFRHPPQGDTTGWYIYSGEELSDDPDFFNHCMLSILTIGALNLRSILGCHRGGGFSLPVIMIMFGLMRAC